MNKLAFLVLKYIKMLKLRSQHQLFIIKTNKCLVDIMKNNFNDTVNNFFKNYQDRGMKKWQGFMLSDHIVALNKDKEEQAKVYSEKDTMSEADISQILLQAFANNKMVSIQLKEKTLDKKIQPDIVGLVKGYEGDKIVIGTNEVELSNINNIQIQ